MGIVRQLLRDFVAGATVGAVNAELERAGTPLRWRDDNGDHRWQVDAETYRGGERARVGDRELHALHQAVHFALGGGRPSYQIVTDRYIDGNPGNNHFSPEPPANYTGNPRDYWAMQDNDPSGTNLSRILGGDLDGIISALPHLKAIGVDAIWISPVMDNPSGVLVNPNETSTHYHYYWQISTTHLDERLTSSGKIEPISALAPFADACHKAGIKVLVDINFDHVAPEGLPTGTKLYAGAEVLLDCATSPLCTMSDTIADWDEPEIGELTGKTYMSLGKILLGKRDDPAFPPAEKAQIRRIWDALQEMAISFVRDGHVDGFRIDVLKHVYRPFIEEFVKRARAMKPDVVLVGEYFSYGYSDAGLDSAGHDMTRALQLPVFDFQLQAIAGRAFAPAGFDYGVLYHDYGGSRIADAREPHTASLAQYLGRMFDEKYFEEAQRNYIFSSNHDKPRFLDRRFWGANPYPPDSALEEEYKLLACLPGELMVYYGDEMFLRYWTNRPQADEEKAKLGSFWGHLGDPYNRIPLPIEPHENGSGEIVWRRQRWAVEDVAQEYMAKAARGAKFMKTLSDFRARNFAVTLGGVRDLDTMNGDPTSLSFVRTFGDNEVLYWHRRGDTAGEAREYQIGWPAGAYADVFTGKVYRVSARGALHIPADPSLKDNSFRTIFLERKP